MLGTKNSIMKQLARIQMLCTVEAEEYEKGRNLQVLQPSRTSQSAKGMRHPSYTTEQSRFPVNSAETGDRTSSRNTPGDGCPAAPTTGGHLQATDTALAVDSACKQHAQTTLGNTGAMVTPLALAQVSASHRHTPTSNHVQLPGALVQGLIPAESTVASAVYPFHRQVAAASNQLAAAGEGAALLQLQQTIGKTQQAVAPLLLQQTNTAPLMQQVLQKQRAEGADIVGEQQAKSGPLRHGKRKGYCVEPDALRRMVEQQLQRQREKQQKEQIRQEKGEQQARSVSQQHQQHLQATAPQQPQQLLQYQQRHQQAQWQQQQQHSWRNLPQAAWDFKHQSHQLQAVETAVSGGASAAAAAVLPTTAAAAADQSVHSQLPLESPGACVGFNLANDTAGGSDLESIKLFGSAQKRLRLSICDDGNHGCLVSPPAAADLAQALVSPVLLPGVSGGLQDPVMPAASGQAVGPTAGAAALSETVLAPEASTPSKFFIPSPAAAAVVDGGAAETRVSDGVTAATPQGLFTASTMAQANRSASRCSAIAAAVNPGNPPETDEPPAQAIVSPIMAYDGIPSAAGAATSTAAAADVTTFMTPSKFFNCSPASADRQAGKPVHDTPITPLLFGLPASPWSRQGEAQQQRQQQGLMSTANPLRTARRCSSDSAAEPSGWVPVAEHSQFVQPSGVSDSTAVTATPASGHVRVGLFSTPLTAAAGKCESACDHDVDPAAAAAAPVDIEGIRRRRSSAAARGSSAPAAPGTTGVEHTLAASVEPGVSLMTPPGQEQQVTATPLTEVV